MEKLEGKTAFITGAASGIGLGIAKACARHGMKVVLTDARRDALEKALTYFQKKNYPAHAIVLDVTDREAYVRAADEAEEVFGKIHVLVNNAGVAAGGGPVYEATFKDWEFIIGVNCLGVVNGINIIVPRILQHGEGGHVVSTSSTAGIFAVTGTGLYNATKYFVAGLMETLACDLEGTGVGASVFCPGPVASNLGISSQAVRPEHLKNENAPHPQPPRDVRPGTMDWSKYFMTPEEVGERVVRGIKRNDLFIWTHPEFKAGIKARNDALLRAIPDEPINEERAKILKNFGTLTYNPIYEKQTTPGPLVWKPEAEEDALKR